MNEADDVYIAGVQLGCDSIVIFSEYIATDGPHIKTSINIVMAYTTLRALRGYIFPLQVWN